MFMKHFVLKSKIKLVFNKCHKLCFRKNNQRKRVSTGHFNCKHFSVFKKDDTDVWLTASARSIAADDVGISSTMGSTGDSTSRGQVIEEDDDIDRFSRTVFLVPREKKANSKKQSFATEEKTYSNGSFEVFNKCFVLAATNSAAARAVAPHFVFKLKTGYCNIKRLGRSSKVVTKKERIPKHLIHQYLLQRPYQLKKIALIPFVYRTFWKKIFFSKLELNFLTPQSKKTIDVN